MPRPRPAWHSSIALAVLFRVTLATACADSQAQQFAGIGADRLRHVLERCYNIEDDAERQIEALSRDFPKSLVPEFLTVARLYWMQAYVQVDGELTARFEQQAQALLKKAQKAMREQPEDPDTAVLASLSHLTLGGFHAEHQRWWSAFWRVRAGRTIAMRVLKDHPEHPEALMPVGVLECYLGRTPAVLKPLALMLGASGDLEAGLEHLRQTRDRGVLTAFDATFYLCILQLDLLGDKEAARKEIEPLARRFPRNPFFQRLLAICELHTGHRIKARERLAAIPMMDTATQFPAITARALLSLCRDCLHTGDFAEALDAADRAGEIASTDSRLAGQHINALFGQAEALKGLGWFEESFARLNQVPASNADAHRRAQNRIREIKQEIGWREPES